MGSVTSKQSPEYRSSLDDINTSAADAYNEAVNMPLLTPVLTHSPTPNFDSFINGSYNYLQETPQFSDDQNILLALPDTATWNLQGAGAGESTNSLQGPVPPRDFSSVPDTNGSLWPLFPTENDWQHYLDAQFSAGPDNASIGAVSTTVSEINLSQLYHQPLQSPEPAALSRDLTEYLDLGGKVSINTTYSHRQGSFDE